MCERFNIDDVARINGIQVIRERGGETFAVCPFCGNKTGKFSYIVSKGSKKNIYHCFSCEAKGNAIELHMKLSGEDFGEDEQAYKLAAKDIFKRLGSGFHAEPARYERTEEVQEAPKADEETVSRTLFAVLKYCDLKERHKKDLLKRGLTEADIKRFRFRSAPTDPRAMCEHLLEEGYTLKGVPGFYIDKSGKWNFSVIKEGYLCPVFDGDRNLLTGFQVRLDKPRDGAKYLWVSSSGKESGTGSGAMCTLLPGSNRKCIILTEGILKATVIYCLLKGAITVVGVPGIKSLVHLKDVIERFKDNAYVIEAFDMDKALTERLEPLYSEMIEKGISMNTTDEKYRGVVKQQRIAQAAEDLRTRLLSEYALDSHDLKWDTKGRFWNGNLKGLDDFLLDYEDKNRFVQYIEGLAEDDLKMRAFLKTTTAS